ncbi:uncharacterized protein METZ01_LOCUS433534, partial [marine metagenome]
NSVHLCTFPVIPDTWRDDELAAKWHHLRAVRRVVTGALEKERAEKRIGSSLQAAPVIHTPPEIVALFEGLDAAELFITSDATFTSEAARDEAFTLDDVAGVAVEPAVASGEKCERCYRVLEEIGANADHPHACNRCADAVEHFQPLPEAE